MPKPLSRRDLLIFGSTTAMLFGAPAICAQAASKPILIVRGKIEKAGADGSVAFDLPALEAFEQTSFVTKTPWHDHAVAFEGVAVATVLDAVGATGTELRLTALNDYFVVAEIADLRSHGALLAIRQDGKPMPISDKGPVFLIFPFDSDTALQHQTYYSKSVWQLSSIEVA